AARGPRWGPPVPRASLGDPPTGTRARAPLDGDEPQQSGLLAQEARGLKRGPPVLRAGLGDLRTGAGVRAPRDGDEPQQYGACAQGARGLSRGAPVHRAGTQYLYGAPWPESCGHTNYTAQ